MRVFLMSKPRDTRKSLLSSFEFFVGDRKRNNFFSGRFIFGGSGVGARGERKKCFIYLVGMIWCMIEPSHEAEVPSVKCVCRYITYICSHQKNKNAISSALLIRTRAISSGFASDGHIIPPRADYGRRPEQLDEASR